MGRYGRRRSTIEMVLDDLIVRRESCASHVSLKDRVIVNFGH